ncbi:hypothetical protein [Saccharothrix luteola]|uniref:hypothetical protein n=1 Tax=Saccharothrix luteola TaxID=2893018 RepID=UPI001E4147BE|nr:hypothetical protein [Saccharothrix luteola]MCC8243354.1 hypothetical protein [Saccharothrix luteola]
MLRRRALAALAGAAIVASGLVTATAEAAPHSTRSYPVLASYTDSAKRHTAFPWQDQDAPLGASTRDGRLHVSRVYLTFDVAQFAGARILGAKLYLQESTTADCTKRAIEVWQTAPVTRDPTWGDAPRRERWLDDFTATGVCLSYPSFDVAAAVRDAAARNESRITVEVAVPAPLERDTTYGRTLYGYYKAALSVQHNQAPSIVDQHRYNSGKTCATATPHPKLSTWFVTLEALPADDDPGDQSLSSLTVDFALWPQDDPTARTERTSQFASTTRVGSASFPGLTDGKTYSWQARAGDGADLSAWSTPCHFVADGVNPSAPAITSPNYPPYDGSSTVPAGEDGVFVFDARGDADTIGFGYTWGSTIPVHGCSAGELGRLICSDPLDGAQAIRADHPGGTATTTLVPPGAGPQKLTAWSIDAAGNRSEPSRYPVFIPATSPSITLVGDEPRWNRDVTLRFAPLPALADRTVGFVYRLDSGDQQVIAAGADGTATITFRADDPRGHTVTVSSRSADGWVSGAETWTHYFFPGPEVHSDVYTDSGEPTGGVGVPGTFTFSPPPGWTQVSAYSYSVDWGEYVDVPAGPDGVATITLTPSTSGYHDLDVYAINADGGYGEYSNLFSFNVA